MAKRILALAAVTMAAMAVSGFAPPADRTTADTSPLPDARIVVSGSAEGTTVRIDGVITRGVERRLDGLFAALPPNRPVTLELASPGGFTSAGHAIIDRILSERKNGRTVATRVRAGEFCESMCVGLFQAGSPRYAAPSAEFMVHAPRIHESGQVTLRASRTMMARLQSLGASPDWLAHVRDTGGFSGAEDHRETARDLVAENANIVTDLLR